MDLLKSLNDLDRPQLLKLRRRINERLHELDEDKHAAVVAAGINLPSGWDNDGQTDGDDMPRTKKKTTKTTYELQLGNTKERSGHRVDCAQLSAVISMDYDEGDEHSEEIALQLVKNEIDGETFEIEIWEGVTLKVTVNASRAAKKDVKVVA